MLQKTNILLVGRSRDVLSGIQGLLEDQHLITLRSHVYGNGQSELWGPSSQTPEPDALVLCVNDDWRSSLPGILQALPKVKPPFLVLSPSSDIDLLRTAMRAGARDVLSPPYEVEELSVRLVELACEKHADNTKESGRMVAFINAKGGSGASFLAANSAVSLVNKYQRKTILLDLDLQFASQPIYLNMNPSDGLVKALEFVDSLDSTAITGYTQVHNDGLHLLTASANSLVLSENIAEERINKLLEVLDSTYQDILVDLPRHIDRLSAAIIERLDQLVIVSQQSVSHLQDTKRLIKILHNHVGITDERMQIVLNRFSKKAEVRKEDFADAFPGVSISKVPSDYALVSESINLGTPVVVGSKRSQLSKAIAELVDRISPQQGTLHQQAGGILGWLGLSERK